jgi:hypothetical protein
MNIGKNRPLRKLLLALAVSQLGGTEAATTAYRHGLLSVAGSIGA